MPSKDESTTACGVSSMMKSTPVRCSSARMLRPSRPMIRPFMSSEASSTTVTVVSAVWLPATRCRASPTSARGRRRPPVRAPFPHRRDVACELVPDEVFGALEYLLAGLAQRHAGDSLQFVQRALLDRLQVVLQLLEMRLAVGRALLPPLELDQLALDVRL